MNSINVPKLSLEMLMGFSDELQKIGMAAVKPATVGEVTKVVSRKGTALSTKQPNYSKVHKDPTQPATSTDLAESSKVIQPPPVAFPRGDL